MNNFEKEVYALLNDFRKNPSCHEKELRLVEFGLKRIRPNDPFIKDIQSFIGSIKTFEKMKPVELNSELCGAAKKLLQEFLKNPDDFPCSYSGRQCEGKIPKEYLGENPGIIFDNGSEEPINVLPRLLLNKSDTDKGARKIFITPEYTQVGIARADYDDENYGVFIFANKVPAYVELEDIDPSYINEYKKAFDLLDYQKAGRISMNDIVDAMDSVKLGETEPVLYNILKELKKENGLYVTFPVFCKKMHGCFTDRKTTRGLKDIFSLLIGDVKQETITLETLKDITKTVGVHRSDSDLAKLLMDGTEDGQISYGEFENVMKRNK